MINRNLLAIVGVAVTFASQSVAAPVVIDSFTDTQLVTAAGAGGTGSGQAAASAVGGNRYVHATLVSGTPAPDVDINGLSPNRLRFSNDFNVDANFRLLYDGGTDSTNSLGLNANFGQGGLNTLIMLQFATDNPVANGLTINLYGATLADVRTVTVSLPDSSNVLTFLAVPFASFSVDNDVDLDNVRAVEVLVTGAPSLDFQLDFIQADSDVPEPSTMFLLGGGFTGLALLLRRRKSA